MIIAPDGGNAWTPAKPRPDETLIRALTRAHRWKRMLKVFGNELVVDGGWKRYDLRIVVITSKRQGRGL